MICIQYYCIRFVPTYFIAVIFLYVLIQFVRVFFALKSGIIELYFVLTLLFDKTSMIHVQCFTILCAVL